MNLADLMKSLGNVAGDAEGVLGKVLPVVSSLSDALNAHGASIAASAPNNEANTSATDGNTVAVNTLSELIKSNTSAMQALMSSINTLNSTLTALQNK
jgi:hypothetical protein